MSDKPIVAGNWKMNKTPQEGLSFVDECVNLLLKMKGVTVIFSPPFTALFLIESILKITPFHLAAQNVHFAEKGAFTGEISIDMLKACGVEYVIIGHSERRHVFNEPENWINKKVLATVQAGLKPIFCIGETLDQRQTGETGTILNNQLRAGLQGVSEAEMTDVIIAYEPVWAIGTGVTANTDQVADAHIIIRDILKSLYTADIASEMAILYGGSVIPDNSAELIGTTGVDGFLIGGAALNVDSFTTIIKIVQENYKKE